MSTMQEFERNICVTPAAMFCYQYYCLIISELQPYRPDTLADIKLAVSRWWRENIQSGLVEQKNNTNDKALH